MFFFLILRLKVFFERLQTKVFVFICAFPFLVYAENDNNLPLDLPRTPVSSVYGYYFPSLNLDSPFPFFNNYGFTGIIQNIFVTGPNLNFGYGYYHQIQNNTVLSNNSEAVENPAYKWQNQDLLTLYGNYSFLYFCQINADLNYKMNRLVNPDSTYDSYNYNKLSFNLSFIYDRRFSSLQQWTLGQVFIYPEEGFLFAAGSSHNIVKNLNNDSNSTINSVFLKSQLLFHPIKPLIFSVNLSGESLLESNRLWAFSPAASVIGSYEIPCDYYIKGEFEMRILIPKGIFWDSPAFWYFNSYSFKFSAGILVGYSGSYAGYFNQKNDYYIHSAYISPMIAIRMNGILLTVLRFDFAITSSKSFNYILSINLGTIGSAPSSIWKSGF